MKKLVEKLSEVELRKTHRISALVPGWFFRVRETSNNAWLAEGKDIWGRIVSCRGSDDQDALKKCAKQAQDINQQLAIRDYRTFDPSDRT